MFSAGLTIARPLFISPSMPLFRQQKEANRYPTPRLQNNWIEERGHTHVLLNKIYYHIDHDNTATDIRRGA